MRRLESRNWKVRLGPQLYSICSSDFRACAQSQRWATCCSFGSVSCSCNAYASPRSVVHKRALPVASSPRSEQRKWLVFAEQIEIFQVKAWLATFKTRNSNLTLLDDRLKKRRKKKAAWSTFGGCSTSVSIDQSSISSASVAAGLFPNLSCLVSLICSLLTEAFYYCNFTNFRCVKISVTSDHGAFGKV